MKKPKEPTLANQLTKALHARRRAAGLCIYDQRDRGGAPHEPPHRGGRCFACWEAKLESGRRKYREARERKLARRARKRERAELAGRAA